MSEPSVGSAPDQGFAATMPLPLFASVMGTCGLGLVWHVAEHRWGLPAVISGALTAIALGLLLVLLAAYSFKVVRFRDRVIAELKNPIRINFLPAISINLILLGILVRPWLEPAANALWMVGAGVQLILTITIVTIWLNSERPPNSLNPAWFIPAVGNILVPVASVPAGYVMIGWFFFSVGLFYWIILGTIVFHRLVIGDALEPPMRPTLAILMAPPAVAFLAWLQLGESLGGVGLVLYFIGLLNFLLLIPQVPGFLKLPFFPSWWAYTFPLAAFTVATFRFASETSAIPGFILIALTVLVTGVISLVAGRTLIAVKRGELAGH